MSTYFDLLEKYYGDKTTQEEKQSLARMLGERDIPHDELNAIWEQSYGEMPPSVDCRIRKQLNIVSGKRRRVTLRASLRILSQIVAIVSVALLYYYWSENRLLTKYDDMIVQVEKGQKSEIYLPDGTRVHLNADTQLSYGKSFNGKQRHVTLSGEAFFEVAKDPSSPFVVHAGSLQIEAIGTAFNVEAYPESKQVTTYLESGQIAIRVNEKELKLEKGQMAEYFWTDGSLRRYTPENAKAYTAWRSNEIYFEDVQFQEVINQIERQYNVSFEIKDKKLHDISFTGTLRCGTLQSVLDALQLTAFIRYTYKNEKIELYSLTSKK